MKYYMLGVTLYFLLGCSTHGNVSSSTPKNIVIEERARVCATCHDPDIKTGFAEAPSLTGRSYQNLVSAIQKVREFDASEPSLRHDLSDRDIHLIATYFSSIK
jgi:cytochrome c553